jgi:hypothetical protein
VERSKYKDMSITTNKEFRKAEKDNKREDELRKELIGEFTTFYHDKMTEEEAMDYYTEALDVIEFYREFSYFLITKIRQLENKN